MYYTKTFSRYILGAFASKSGESLGIWNDRTLYIYIQSVCVL